ncbi:hypothetical protein I316_06822 [Kwoniella heveanensis BCC8398]|uniref:Solute carrier family 25 (Mitochondrial dicarboxylate transporter), member 10 n=1 Tax=Kwoniella heveanensis BCC8398 TaxID=1296120 RepID=A0A1B9GJZ5_9TREE|nr:hypothetical protein I316_06822 [Kwoniella heveanensis BCC8398]
MSSSRSIAARSIDGDLAMKAPLTLYQKQYPFWLGGVANTLSSCVTHPLDLTKARLQTSGQRGMFQSIAQTVRSNGIRGLYDGLTGTLLRQMTYSMGRFAIYEAMKKKVAPNPGPVPLYKLVLSGSVAGGIAGVIGNPFELIMVRMQADKAKPHALRYNYRNSIQGLYRMLVDEGPKAFWRGLVPNGFRAALMNMGQLPSYEFTKQELLNYMEDGPAVHIMASVAAGTIATTITAPPDIIKARIMNTHGSATTSSIQVIKQSLVKEGPMFMFKGWVPAWCRLQPTTILIFMTLEQLKKGVNTYREAGGTLI